MCLSVQVLVTRRVQLFLTPWTVACQVPVESSEQEHWTGLPFIPPRDLPHPGIESVFPALQADSLPTEPPRMSSWSLFLLGEIFLSREPGSLAKPRGSWRDKMLFPEHRHLRTQ